MSKVQKFSPYSSPGQRNWVDWVSQYGPTVGNVARHYLKRKMRQRNNNQGQGGKITHDTISMQGTKDMIRGPHYQKSLGRRKRVNIPRQLGQLVDDTKIFKQQFKLKINSGAGLRQWCQIVCRYRAAPGKEVSSELQVHGATLNPNVIADIKQPADYYNTLGFTDDMKYRVSCPPTVEGQYILSSAAESMYLNSTLHTGDSTNINQNRLFFLNMPLTYLEQDMFNMGMGPGIRKYTRPMHYSTMPSGNEMTIANSGNTNATYRPAMTQEGELVTNATMVGVDRSRTTTMKAVTHPQYKELKFDMQNAPLNTALLTGNMALPMVYDFRLGWGINQLDYNLIADSLGDDDVPNNDPQWIKTNNSDNTIATIKNGEVSFTFNNLGDAQAYVTTLVVVQKHVDEHYWSMPTALTDTYLKSAQEFIKSGEWSITNNITSTIAADSAGSMPSPYMYVSHPSIKPFGKIPTKFLEDFNKHFIIKSQTTMKLGIGERQSCKIELGGLQYSTESLAMNKSLHSRYEPQQNQYYHPAPMSSNDDAMASMATGVKANFPLCCQQGTTHFLFGVQGFNAPFAKKTDANGNPSVDGTVDNTTCEGRWAVPAIVDISGTYKEIIAPLTTGKSNPIPIQRCLTKLPQTQSSSAPQNNVYPIATAMPRVRTIQDSAMEIGNV